MMAHMSLEKQLQGLLKNKGKLKTSNGVTVEDMLLSEAKNLHRYIQEEISKIYDTSEGWYERSRDLERSLVDIGALFIDPVTNTIEIYFEPQFALHDSWITKKFDSSYEKKGYVPLLMNEGFTILFSNGKQFSGTHFIEDAVQRFNAVKKDGISIKIIKTL